MGKKATMINRGGEGSPRWRTVERKAIMRMTPTSISSASPRTSSCRRTKPYLRWEWGMKIHPV
jgi:hypothetical protein